MSASTLLHEKANAGDPSAAGPALRRVRSSRRENLLIRIGGESRMHG